MVLDGAPSVVSMCFVRAQKDPGWGFGTGQRTHRDFARCPAGCWAGLPVPSRGAPAGGAVTGKLVLTWPPLQAGGCPVLQTGNQKSRPQPSCCRGTLCTFLPSLSFKLLMGVILMTSVVANRSQTFKCQLCVAVSTRDSKGDRKFPISKKLEMQGVGRLEPLGEPCSRRPSASGPAFGRQRPPVDGKGREHDEDVALWPGRVSAGPLPSHLGKTGSVI